MQNWTKNLSRAAVVAAGAVALGSGASMGLASTGGVPGVGIEQAQHQGLGSDAMLKGCGQLGGFLSKANLACPMGEDEDEDEDKDKFKHKFKDEDKDKDKDEFKHKFKHKFKEEKDEDEDDKDLDLGLGGISTMGDRFNGPISAFGGALAMVNFAKSYTNTVADKDDACNRCEGYDEYVPEKAEPKPYKAKPYKAKKVKHKAKPYKAKPFKVKPYKAKSYKAYKAKGHGPKAPRWGGPARGHSWYAQGPLPSTNRLAVLRPAPESAARLAAVPEPAAVQKVGESRVGAFFKKLVRPFGGRRHTSAAPGPDQLQAQDVLIRSDAKAALKHAGLGANPAGFQSRD